MTWHEIEREQLAAALRAVPPDAPTLCAGWQARHLAAHLVLREHSPLVAAGLAVPALAARTDTAVDRLADAATTESAYRDLVARVASPPPGWHPMSWAGDLANVTEFFVHTEDVRRGAGPVPARVLEPGLVDALWTDLLRMAALRLRRQPAGVVLVRPDGVRRRVRSPHGGHGTVVVRGDVGELLLYLTGRGRAADVRLEGAAQDLAALTDLLPLT